MSNHRDNEKHRRNDLKSLPSEVLLKARSKLISLGGALKPKQEQQRSKRAKYELPLKERLRNSRSEPDFDRKVKHRSRVDEPPREGAGVRPRPVSVGAMKRYECDTDFHCGSFPKETSLQRQYDSTENLNVPARLVMPSVDRLGHDQDTSERPRKKLSFREPEIIGSASATLGRSNKLMGVNSLTRRPKRLSRSEMHASLEGLDSDLESQAMRIVRTIGQAFEVCHKMQENTPDNPAPSTSSAVDDAVTADDVSDVSAPKEPTSECGASESVGAASTSKLMEESKGNQNRPKHLDLLPPPLQRDGQRTQLTAPVPSINLPDLPECVTKVEISSALEGDLSTPLSTQHQLQLLRERLEQQAQQTRAAVAQLLLLRDQLAVEQAARCEAQARTHQLLVHNKELLEHIAALVAHLQEKEKGDNRSISAQTLTLLPQIKTGVKEAIKGDNFSICNGNCQQFNSDALMNFIAKNNKMNQNVENNNINLSTYCLAPTASDKPNSGSSTPNFGSMSNDQIQNYLISKFQDMSFAREAESKSNNNKQFYQNCNAFPHIPPLTNHCSNTDLTSLLNHQGYKDNFSSSDEFAAAARTMSIGQSQNSLYSNSQPTTSKDSSPDGSSDEGIPFIMPLSHNGTLTATGDDGRVRLIVPISPSGSTSDVGEPQPELRQPLGMTLKVPGIESLAPAAPITRSTSEKVPNRSEMMTALRSQWTRHTTK